jgi:nucleotide-binding universal stress UspA family protein
MRLIVALDGSPFAERALPVARALASRTGGTLDILAVHEPGLPVRGGQGAPTFDLRFDQEERAALARYTQDLASIVGSGPEAILARGVVAEGEPARRIAEYASEVSAQVIVVTTHGRRGPSRLWLGSVTSELLRRTTIPVLVIRAAHEHEPPPPTSFTRIAVGLDGSAAGEAALATARVIFGFAGVEYLLVRVIPKLHPFQRVAALESAYAREEQEALAEARAYLDGVAAPLRAAGISVRTEAVVHENEAAALVEHAESANAQLIAVGAHNKSRIERMFLGSVADKVLRTAATAVLVCRESPEARTEEPVGAGGVEAVQTPQLRRLVVGVDFGAESQGAARWIAAQFPDADILLASVIHIPEPPSFLGTAPKARKEVLENARLGAQSRLSEFIRELHDSTVSQVVALGTPAETLVDLARAHQADVIVVGEYGERTGMARSLGSTTDRALRLANVPVLVARKLPSGPPRHILIAIDDADTTTAVLAWGRALCERFRASATLLHVISSATIAGLGIAANHNEHTRGVARTKRGALNWLTGQAASLRDANIPTTVEVDVGEPADAIAAHADAHAADLIVLGRRGAGRVRRFLIGSVTHSVLHIADQAVFVVPGERDHAA